MKDLTLVYVGKDRANVESFYIGDVDREKVDSIGISNEEGLSLAAIGNYMMDRCQTPVFGLCHADAIFRAGALDAFVACANGDRSGSFSVCGIVGAKLDGRYACAIEGGGRVSCLDGMAVFFHRDLGLRFDDETFDGFHCHVEDLCLQAHARGIPVTVPAADAHHRNHKQTAQWLADYRKYRARLAEKWKGTEFVTT